MVAVGLDAPAGAQGGERLSIVSEVDPPRSESFGKFSETAGQTGIDTDAVYVDELSGSLESERGIRETRRVRREFSVPALDGSLGVAIAIIAIVAALALWLKFGGTGTLLSAKPKDIEKKQQAPEKWQITEREKSMDGQALLSHLAAMKDRQEALARLLRHCLLSAGELCDTRFARSDTEREAFARLPAGFKHHEALRTLLRDSELAHYGGRAVSEETFEHNLQLGRILLTGRSAHA
jgi:hypothetical protein